MSNQDRNDKLSPYCRHIESKKRFLSQGLPRTERDILDASQHCWCFHTKQVLGPDRGIVHPEQCQRGRSCFESPLEVST